MGWTKDSEKDPKSRELGILASKSVGLTTCRKQLVKWTSRIVSESMICVGKMTGNLDSCQADTGGPLILDGKLVGVASWSVGCAQDRRPGVFTSVPGILSWIRRELDGLREVC